jgi:hypothetical protein
MKKLFTIKNFVLLVIILVMANNIEHLSWVHQLIARKWFNASVWHSIAVVIIIELGIIVMVKKGEIGFAFLFAACIFILSLIYYPVGEFYQAHDWSKLIAAVVYSYMFSFSIFHFAVIQAKENEVTEATDRTHAELQLKTRQVKELTEAQQQNVADLTKIRAQLQSFETLQNEINKERTCPKCGKLCESANSRRSHQGRCKVKSKT